MAEEYYRGKGTKDSPWTVGSAGHFVVLTYLEEGEREIDVDDKEAFLNVKVEMRPNPQNLVAHKVKVTLDFSEENILLHGKVDETGSSNGKTKGAKRADSKSTEQENGGAGKNTIVLAENATITPDAPLEMQLTVKTGYWGSTDPDPSKRLPASPGRKEGKVTIDYELGPEEEGENEGRGGPVPAVMLLYIAPD